MRRALARAAGRAHRHPQGRRRLSAARSRLPGRAAGLHAGRCRHGGARHPIGAARSAARHGGAHGAPRHRWGGDRRAAGHCACPRARATQQRLCHLYVGLHRSPQGRGRPPWRHPQSGGRPDRSLRHHTRCARAAVRLAELRCGDLGDCDGPDRGRDPGRAGGRAQRAASGRPDPAAQCQPRDLAAGAADGAAGGLAARHPGGGGRCLRGRRGGALVGRAADDQRLWADRGDGVRDHERAALRCGCSGHWRPDLEHAGLCAGCGPAAGSGGACGRALRCGCGAGARLSGARGADGGAVRGRSAWSGGEPDVPHRRPGALARRRGAGLPGAGGRAGEGPRLPDRAGRDRGVPDATCVGGAGGGGRARGCRPTSGSLLTLWRAAGASVDAAALRAHVAQSLPDYMVPAAFVVLERLAADAQRQARPARATGAGAHAHERPPRAAHTAGGAAVRAVRRGAGARAHRHRRQLLRARAAIRCWRPG